MRWVATEYVMSRDAMCHRGVWKGALLKSLFSASASRCSYSGYYYDVVSFYRRMSHLEEDTIFLICFFSGWQPWMRWTLLSHPKIWNFTRIKWKPSPNLPEPGHIANGDSKNWWQWGIVSETEELWVFELGLFHDLDSEKPATTIINHIQWRSIQRIRHANSLTRNQVRVPSKHLVHPNKDMRVTVLRYYTGRYTALAFRLEILPKWAHSTLENLTQTSLRNKY